MSSRRGAFLFRWLALASATFLTSGLQAGLLPKLMKKAPEELQGEFVLLARINPDKTQEDFTTNAPAFATIFSNRVVLAGGTVRVIEGVIGIKEKGTNVHLVSFPGKASWIIVPGKAPSELVVLQGNPDDPKASPTFFVVRRKGGPGGQTNAPASGPKAPGISLSREEKRSQMDKK